MTSTKSNLKFQIIVFPYLLFIHYCYYRKSCMKPPSNKPPPPLLWKTNFVIPPPGPINYGTIATSYPDLSLISKKMAGNGRGASKAQSLALHAHQSQKKCEAPEKGAAID